MNPKTKSQLTQSLALPGVAAWCICDANHAFEHHCFTDWFKAAQLQTITMRLAGALEGLRKRQTAARQFCWVFEHAQLLLAQRTNGETLVLFVEHRPGLNLSIHQAALAEFSARS